MYENMKLGRFPTRRDRRTLMLAKYAPHLPIPPAERDWTNGLAQWGMMRNDTIGCCTAAAAGHAIQTWTMNTATIAAPADPDIVAMYSGSSGYDPANPITDRGAYELDVLNYWRKNPLAGHSLEAYVSLVPQNEEHVKQAVCLFGGIYIGLNLPESASKGGVWDIHPNDRPWGGHAVWVPRYAKNSLFCVTWGGIQEMTWDFWYAYCSEAYGLLGTDWLSHFGPGQNLRQALLNDLARITG